MRAAGYFESKDKDYLVKRCLVLASKIILSVGGRRARHEDRIVVVAYDPRGLRLRRYEAELLTTLKQSTLPIARLVPTYFGEFDFKGQPCLVFEEIPGVTIDRDCGPLDEATANASQALAAVHRATAARIRGRDAYAMSCERIVRSAVNREPQLAVAIELVAQGARLRLEDEEAIETVLFHGDYKIENVIVDERTLAVRGIIDWGLGQRNGLPLLDVWHLITHNRTLRNSTDCFDVLREIIVPQRYASFERALLDRYLAAIPVSQRLIPALEAMFLLHHFGCRVQLGGNDAARRKLEACLRMLAQRLQC
jgi:aminoglycoside phosphotransferase (APT) family kinase protein